MKRWGTILCLCLLPILLFSACAEATAQVDFVANKDVKKIFDDVHTVGYILDDIRKVDFYKEMQPNDSYTKKTGKKHEPGHHRNQILQKRGPGFRRIR